METITFSPEFFVITLFIAVVCLIAAVFSKYYKQFLVTAGLAVSTFCLGICFQLFDCSVIMGVLYVFMVWMIVLIMQYFACKWQDKVMAKLRKK